MRVFLIHGMGRSPASLALLGRKLRRAGHHVSSYGYSVRTTPLDVIADRFVTHVRAVQETDEETEYAIIGHSLGCIITRLASPELPSGFTRFAMLAPPNRPPLLARRLRDQSVFRHMTGDAGQRLADPEFYAELPVPEVRTIILAGDAAKRLTVLPFDGEPADGVVSVEETRLRELPHRVVPAWHTFIMNHPVVTRTLLGFLGKIATR